ncbi:putative coatomer subunit alpha [Ceratocystis fimbriata CBS 114723]|uniref:Coatomer subunit alpha n=1 Tax=Ceratocystis fimbriata CBS 114723 TaxID=1035309 RepID=A0A2C5XD41_9PEZI|nr:putative coatomer subunit alpha [Ceratocystis fimbriata CBS 114723]
MSTTSSMLTKFESKSSRAKGIAFHPKRPWILVSLHSSTIQLWDYRMGTLIDRFEEHDGPVRAVDFHPTQPLFVSGGDDYKIKVWSYQTRRCLFTLNGHLDYIRTVFFHRELPWIVSCSDDQTIRIWNWQNRSLICTMTGHNHYVMCAQFHPKDDLVVSASLDQSVRVWDISGLRKKHSAPTSSLSFEDQMARRNQEQADMFGNTDAVVKFVLEGHDRGVNWVAFHPTMPLIVSAGDDRLVKLWRMSETKAWEVDTCRGHFQNASACLFHPHQDLILSVSEDKTIRVWDLNKRTAVQSFKRENERMWVIAAHPEINLFAVGHDNGVMVFKLERERPASAIHQNSLFYITKDKHVKSYDFKKNLEGPTLTVLKKLGSAWTPPRTMSYNPAERSILVTSPADGNSYELINLPREGSGALESPDSKRGSGNSAIFVARNRFAVLDVAAQTIEIKDLSNNVTRSFKPPAGTTDIYFGGTGNLLIITPTAVYMYDIQQKKVTAEHPVNGVKYVVWSNDNRYVALLSKHNITILSKSLEHLSGLHETIRIKSACWDDTGVLLYSTLNHVKYTLLNGDNGIVRTLDQTVYLVRVQGRNLYCLDRNAKPRLLPIDPTEYRFKLALVKRNYEEMLHIIQNSSLVGQSIIAYLQKKGYPEIALQFVQDPATRFELAIECGNLDVGLEMARELDKPQLWQRLGTEALAHGNHQIVEMCYQKQKSFDKLSFLYLSTGDHNKLARMAKIAEHRGDFTSRFQNALFLGDVEDRIQMFKEIDLYPLAYITAKAHGLEEECQAILEASGLTEEEINAPAIGGSLSVPKAIVPTHAANWPTKASSQSVFEKALLGQVEGLSLEDNQPTEDLMDVDGDDAATSKAGAGAGASAALEDDDDAAGWDMGDDAVPEIEGDFVNVETAEAGGSGLSEAEMWARNSPLAVDHVAGGSFETAMQLLNRQVGAVNFAPIKPRFLEVFSASKTYLPASSGLPPLVNYIRRTLEETDPRSVLPIVPRDLEHLAAHDLQRGYDAMKANKLEDGITVFKGILHAILINAVSSEAEVAEAKKLVASAAEYTVAMGIELSRRSLGAPAAIAENPALLKRSLELSAYFTIPKIEVPHRQLVLGAAMQQAIRAKNYNSALSFASRIIANGGSGKIVENAKKTKAQCERNPNDAVEIDFDQFAEFEVCAASHTPIYSGSAFEECAFDGSKYQPKFKGQVCRVCEVCEIGKHGSGLKLFA